MLGSSRVCASSVAEVTRDISVMAVAAAIAIVEALESQYIAWDELICSGATPVRDTGEIRYEIRVGVSRI